MRWGIEKVVLSAYVNDAVKVGAERGRRMSTPNVCCESRSDYLGATLVLSLIAMPFVGIIYLVVLVALR